PDFLYSDDPWFRPVDLQLGPDGAIYVADFYNRIIGHYEVPLTHPGRDRTSGRIWRIVYRGDDGKKELPKMPNLAAANGNEVVEAVANSTIAVRMLATNQLTDRIGPAAVEPLLAKLKNQPTTTQKTHGLWILYRLGKLDHEMLLAATKDSNREIRVHAIKI